MAMNEDSVVSSLNELRRMANDRARRETETRSRVEPESPWDQRASGGRRTQMRPSEARPSYAGNGYQDVQLPGAGGHPTLMGGHAPGQAQPQQGYGYGYGYSHPAQAAMPPETYQEPVRQKSAVGPVLLTILLLGGAAGGGYWKLQQDWQATLRARDAALLQAEEGRNKAIEAASRAEQQAKIAIAAAEKAKALPDKALPPVDPAAAAPVAAPKAVAAKSSKAEKNSRRGRRAVAVKKTTARVEKAPAAVAAHPPLLDDKKAAALPKIAGKKKLQDDPLAGLKL